jgi:hypothetical protein
MISIIHQSTGISGEFSHIREIYDDVHSDVLPLNPRAERMHT